MSEEEIILTWLGIVSAIGLNGFAAGVMAFLHGRRRPSGKATRVFLAVAFSGLLPASVFLPMAFADRQFILGEGPLITALAFAVMLAMGMLISLPGALLVAPRLSTPSAEFRIFE